MTAMGTGGRRGPESLRPRAQARRAEDRPAGQDRRRRVRGRPSRNGLEGARRLAERLQDLLRSERGLPEGFSASFGIAHFPQASSVEELLLGADACLYRAKEGGRDSIVVQRGEPAASRKR